MDQPLTKIQLEIVMYVANGYRSEEIAKRLHRSKSSIDKSIASARSRAGAKTLPHLVSMTIAEGLLVWTADGERQVQES